MFLRAFSAQLKDVLFSKSNVKYKLIDFLYLDSKVIVKCEFLETGVFVNLDLDEIIKKNKLQFFSSPDILIISKKFDINRGLSDHNVSNISEKKYQFYYPITIVFIICLLTSNLAAVKIIDLGWGITVPGGIIIFPLLYIINDVLTEVYGFAASRKAIWMALFCNLIFSIFLYSIVYVPYPEYWHGQEAYAEVFTLSPRIFVASFSSYLLGEMTNATILTILKLKYKGKYFATRAITSTFIGAFLESAIFCFIAFSKIIGTYQIINMILLLTAIKVLYEILLMPFTSKIVSFLKFNEEDAFDKPSFKFLFPFLKS